MWFTRIEYSQVLRDMEAPIFGINNTHKRFNTSFHTQEDAPDLKVPSKLPYSYKRWLPLVLRSRELSPSIVQTITIPNAQARLILRIAETSIPSGGDHLSSREEIERDIVPLFANLTFPPEGLFMRLDACSAKDGVRRNLGQSSLHTVEDVVFRLVTSARQIQGRIT
ncbi:hypothetical protein F4781DRAFT_388002 [Annulohypoxylon bovei var. microspora]|nr:hypothetical protein F4781DRAFT_388002 [Annulohypoxylon bovei var. microspora]